MNEKSALSALGGLRLAVGVASWLTPRPAGKLFGLDVTANPHALGFYNAAGFIDCGVAQTDFGAAPRMVLTIHLLPLR